MAVAAQSSRQVSRNGFMIAVMSIVGTVIGVFYVGALLRYLYPKSSDTPPLDVTLQPDGVLDPGTGQLIPFVNGVTKEAFYYPTVSDKSVVVGVFVMKNEANGPLDASNLQVVEQTCTHLGCPVAWVPGDNRYECPCHGSQFNRQLKRVAGPAQDPLHIHEFKLNGTKLTILKRKS